MVYFDNIEKRALAVFIFITGLYSAKCLYNLIYTFIIGPAVNKVDYKSKGKWAMVTGCTDGIGKQYAKELAARGCDIVLVSRSMGKLKATSEEIENEYKVSTKIVQVDFSDDESIYDKLAKEIEGLEIGTVVNNVGISYMYPQYYLEIPDREKSVQNILRANIVSMTRVTALVLPAMVSRGKGVIINIGSGSSIIPSPLLTVYAASKAFVEKFSEGIEMEYGKRGIIIQCVLPGFVCTNMSGIRRASVLAPTAKTYVRSAMKLVGTTSNTAGYLPHAAFFMFLNTLHSVAPKFSVWLVTRSMETSLHRALKKYKKQ